MDISSLKSLKNPLKVFKLLNPNVLCTVVKEVFTINEYKYIKSLTNISKKEFKGYRDYLLDDRALFFELEKSYSNHLNHPFLYQRFNRLLYVLVRALKPKIIVETGIAAGISSSFILKGLHDNGFGELYSIDLPLYDPTLVNLPTAKKEEPGWIIPERFKDRWHFIPGKSEERLKPLLNQLGQIDIFFHDSLHTYDHMTFEYTIAWLHIKTDGLLLSDNIDWNKAFHDFSNKINRKYVYKYHFGAMRK